MGLLSSEEEERGFSEERYSSLQLRAAFERREDYSEACQELALLLRQEYASAAKDSQARLYEDTLAALQTLQRMDGRKQQRGALTIARAAEAVFPKQRKAAAAKEFKAASLELRRRQKKERASSSLEDEVGTLGSADDLPLDALRTVFASLDGAALATACCVCRSWREIGEDDSLWELHFASTFGQDWTSAIAAHMQSTEHSPLRKQSLGVAGSHKLWDLALTDSWKEAFRWVRQMQFHEKVFASNRAFCKECRKPLWIRASGSVRQGSTQEHEHKPIPWGPQQVAAWVAYTWESSSSDESSSDSEPDVSEYPCLPAKRRLWAIRKQKCLY